jgi:hypothetical protein
MVPTGVTLILKYFELAWLKVRFLVPEEALGWYKKTTTFINNLRPHTGTTIL